MIVLYESACPSYPDYLMHHGVKGQRWGIRRFQNLDGSWKNGARRSTGYDRVKVDAKDKSSMQKVNKAVTRFHRGSSVKNHLGYASTVGLTTAGLAAGYKHFKKGRKIRAIGSIAVGTVASVAVGNMLRGSNSKSAAKMADKISKSTGMDRDTAHSMASGYQRTASMLTGEHIKNQVANSIVTAVAASATARRGHVIVSSLITAGGGVNAVRMAVKAHGQRKQLRNNMHNDVYEELKERRGY